MTNTEILTSDHPQVMDRAISIFKDGGLVALPTDTVYGLAADVWNGSAVSKLYEVKGRSELKSIPVLISDESAIGEVARHPSQRALALANHFWPGPLTLVLSRKPNLPSVVSASDSVGVRAPDHEFALALLRLYGPLAVTSANPSGAPNATKADQVAEGLGGMIDLIVDAGETAGGIPSTVVDLTVDSPVILRQGPISLESLLRVWDNY